MGYFDYKNVCLQIEVKDNLTDRRFLDFTKEWNFKMDDYLSFYTSVKGTIFNESSNKIVKFFVDYKDGILKPDKCGTYNPLKHTFNDEDILRYQEWLSFPAGCLLLKKNKSYSVEIKNRYWGLSWNGKNSIVNKPIRKLPIYLGKITFWFSKQRKTDMNFLKTLVTDLCDYLGTDYGIIFNQEDGQIFFDLSHPDNVGNILKEITFD